MLKRIFYVLLALIVILVGAFAFTYRSDVPVTKLKIKYANAPSKFMEVKGLQVHYRDEGQGMPIVLVMLVTLGMPVIAVTSIISPSCQ